MITLNAEIDIYIEVLNPNHQQAAHNWPQPQGIENQDSY